MTTPVAPATSLQRYAARSTGRTRPRRRLHELVPGGAHTYARGSDQYPEDMAPVIAAGGRPRRGPGRQLASSSTAWACGRSPWATATGPWSTPRARPPADGMSFSRPERLGAAGGRDVPRPGPRRRHGEVREERLRRDDGRGQGSPAARPAATWSAVCATQPFFSTDDWFIGTTPMKAGIPDVHVSSPRRLPLQRPRLGQGGARPPSRPDSRADPRAGHRDRRAGAGIPRGTPEARRRRTASSSSSTR